MLHRNHEHFVGQKSSDTVHRFVDGTKLLSAHEPSIENYALVVQGALRQVWLNLIGELNQGLVTLRSLTCNTTQG